MQQSGDKKKTIIEEELMSLYNSDLQPQLHTGKS